MPEGEGHRPPGAEDFKMRGTQPQEKQGFFKAMTKGTLKGSAEMVATMAVASMTDKPVQPANLFKDESEGGNRSRSGAERPSNDNAKQQEGEGKQDSPDSAEASQAKREQKAASSGRERSQPPVKRVAVDRKSDVRQKQEEYQLAT